MFDFAWSELMLIGVVALVVIGPKDLPRVLRVVGQWVRQARAIAREFQGSLDQMVREAELDDLKRHMDRATSFNVENEIRRTIDPQGEIQEALSAPVLPQALTNPLTNPVVDPPQAAPVTAVQAAPLESALPPSAPGPEAPGPEAPAAAAPVHEEAGAATGRQPSHPTT